MRARFWIMLGLGMAASAAILTIVQRQPQGTIVCTWPAPDPHGESFWGPPSPGAQGLRTREEWARAARRLSDELCAGSVTPEHVFAFAAGAADGVDRGSRSRAAEDTMSFKLRASGGEEVGSFEVVAHAEQTLPSIRMEVPCTTPAVIAESSGAQKSSLEISIVTDRSGLRLCGAICRAKTDHSPAAHERMLARGAVRVGAVLRVDGSCNTTWTSMNEHAVMDAETGERRWNTPMGAIEARGRPISTVSRILPTLELAASL